MVPLLPALGRMAKGVLALASGTFWALAKGGLYVASRYPRHSLAAGASIVIMGAVLYTQLRSGKGARRPVTASIPGDATNLLADAGTSAAAAKRNEVSKDSAANDNSHVANAKDSSKLDPHGDATASSGVGSPSDKSSTAAAPTATAVNDASSPPPNVAEVPASGQEHLPAPGNVNSPGELVELPKSEPPATAAPEHDHAAATLLTQTPPEPAPLPSASPIKDNLGSADPVGMAPPAPATTANLSPAPNRSGEPPSLPAPTGDPMQLAAALEPVGDEKPSNPASARDPIGPEPTNREPSLPGDFRSR